MEIHDKIPVPINPNASINAGTDINAIILFINEFIYNI